MEPGHDVPVYSNRLQSRCERFVTIADANSRAALKAFLTQKARVPPSASLEGFRFRFQLITYLLLPLPNRLASPHGALAISKWRSMARRLF